MLPDGTRLHYQAWGAGEESAVLVHGYSMSSAAWDKVKPLLPAGYRYLALDLRGFGRSDKPESGYGCPELAGDIAAFLDALDIPRAVLVGHSFGGLVVQHFASRHPERVRALVLANTCAAGLPPRGITPAVECRINGYGSAEQNRAVLCASVPRYFDAANVSRRDIDHFVDIGLQAGTPALREALRANYATPAVPAALLAAVRVPVLILVSAHDLPGAFDNAVAMSDAFHNSRIHVFAHSGHTPMWEKPEEFAAIIAGFLKGRSL